MATRTSQESSLFRNLTVLFKPYLERLAPRLDWFFVTRPEMFIPTWIIMAAGLAASRSYSEPELFWHVHWDTGTFFVFLGATLIVAAAFILNQHLFKNRGQLQVTVAENEVKSDPRVKLAGWICLGLGLAGLFPGEIGAFVAGVVVFITWGLAFGWTASLKYARGIIEAGLHTIAGVALLYLGWATGDAPWEAGFPAIPPYLLAFMAVSIMTGLLRGRSVPEDSRNPSSFNYLATTVIAAGLVTTATIFGLQRGDPVISTTAILTLPFYVLGLIYQREKDAHRTVMYSILALAIFTGARYPLIYIPIIADFYLTRFYFKHRIGIRYPSFSTESPSLST